MICLKMFVVPIHRCYLSEIEEEAGVLASLREVGEKHCDTDEEHRGVLADFTQRLFNEQQEQVNHLQEFKTNNFSSVSDMASTCFLI